MKFRRVGLAALGAMFALIALLGYACYSPEKRLPLGFELALKAPTRMTFYSLEPMERPGSNDESFHGFKIIGKYNPGWSEASVAAGEFRAAVARSDGRVAACFAPRHALRIRGLLHTYDLLLCFECSSISPFFDDVPLPTVPASGSPEKLNSLLTRAGIPLAKTREEWVGEPAPTQPHP